MIAVAACLALALSLLAPAASSMAGASPLMSLTASPARVQLSGTSRATIELTNYGSAPAVLDIARSGFALDLRGRPKIVRRGGTRAGTSWLTVQPRRLVLRPRSTARLSVWSRVPRRAEPGDHFSLVLLTTRPRKGATLSVRMRLGVLVVVRVPGKLVRRLELRGLRVRRSGRIRALELSLANRGNVTEELEPGRVSVSLVRRDRVLARLRAAPREVLPGARGIVEIRYRGRLHGWLTALVEIKPVNASGRAVRRAFWIRL